MYEIIFIFGMSCLLVADILARASGIDVISFSGFGNENPAPGNTEFYRVTQDAFGLMPSLVFPLGRQGTLRLAGILKYASTDPRPRATYSTCTSSVPAD